MITKKIVIQQLADLKQRPVKFQKFGAFFLSIMMMPIKDQVFIMDRLTKATLAPTEKDCITIIGIERVDLSLPNNDEQYRFMLTHEFKCKYCGHMEVNEINLCAGMVRYVCEVCADKSYEYNMDQAGMVETDD